MAIWTNAGRNLIASAIQSTGVDCAITYVSLSGGCGTLAVALTSGVAITTLALDLGLPAPLAGGASLTLTDGVNSETCTLAAGGAPNGATTLTINSFTPTHAYAAHTTGLAPTPNASDTALYNESQRVAAAVGTAGVNAGESLNAGYFDGTQPTAIYLMVGYFGGSTATGTLATGTLMIEDVQFWNHTANADSNMYQADDTI